MVPRRLPKAMSLLPLFIIVSLAVHVGALALFQIVYPSPPAKVRRSAEVYFLKPSGEAVEALGPWLAASDPALYSRFQTDSRTPMAEPTLEYVPSFDLQRPTWKVLPPRPLTPNRRIDLPSGEALTPPLPTGTARLRVDFSGKLANRSFAPPSPPAPLPPAGEIPESPIFSLAVAADGRPLYVFLEHSSGFPELDTATREYLQRGHFAPAEHESAPPTWGRATFLWPRPTAP